MSYVGILFGQLELGMSTLQLTLLALEVPIFALIGVYAHQYIQRRWKLSMKGMLIVTLLEMAVLPVYGMIGFIPGSPLGLMHWWELYVFGCLYGYVLGYIQSNSRVLYSMLIP
jgi:UMF1 family MFS transporter